MERGYQNNFSIIHEKVTHDIEGRTRKAKTILMVLKDYFKDDTEDLDVLDIGASTGVIDSYLSNHFKTLTCIDIDKNAIEYARNNFQKDNLNFKVADAMQTGEKSEFYDIVICSHVYEHVPDQKKLMTEIYRVLKPGGVCYFSAGNRLNIIEPHYGLPFLSILPRFLSHIYLRITGKGKKYYEKHLTYWELRKLTADYSIHDYTMVLINNPGKYHAEYMLPKGSSKSRVAKMVSRLSPWLLPSYIWLLEKDADS